MRRRKRRLKPMPIILLAVIICLIAFAFADRNDKAEAQDKESVEQIAGKLETSLLAADFTPAPEETPAVEQVIFDTGESYETQREILALVIYQEHGGDASSDEARMAVGCVFVNRVADGRFPDSFEEVALQERQWGELHWTGLIWPERAAEEEEAHAVERAYECAERILSGELALPEGIVWASENIQGDGIHSYIDGMYFCY